MSKNHKYSQDEIDFLVQCVEKRLSQTERARAFNERFGLHISLGALVMKCSNLGITKRGNDPRKKYWVGDEAVKVRKSGRKEIFVKAGEPSAWKPKSHLVWEEHTGSEVPNGHILIFLDGDNMNCVFSNLALVPRAVNARINQNGLRTQDALLTETGINVGTVLAEIGKRQKAKKET